MPVLPTGTVTFLFTDIEGSTRLWEQHPVAMQSALPQHDRLLAAVAAQRALQREPWQTTGPLRVRMALHTGEADLREGDYYGAAVNRCARLRAVAHGGQCEGPRARPPGRGATRGSSHDTPHT